MLPSLQRYLPPVIYEPLERRPNERHLTQVRDHLTTLLKTVKTYLPLPVVLAPQPAGEAAGGMYQGVFLFGDVSGFTPLSEQLKALGQAGAERIMDIINRLFSELVGALFDHGGTLLKFGGDALLGLFPADSDEAMATGALQAVQAALAMQAVMQQEKFAAIEVPGGARALQIKCGISSGPYFAAHIGTPPRPDLGTHGTMAYITTGHTVNLAERAEGHAYPGEVAITKDAYALIQDQIEVGAVTRSPDENFFLVQNAPVAPVESLRHPTVLEPPEGDLQAQITYLVERLNRLTAYLSDELISRIVTNPSDASDTTRITPEHRPVTVMFANYVGISDLIEDMGNSHPELIIAQLNNYFVHMVEVVEKYEGMVARMDQYAVGDRLVIFFGAPRAHEDDPVRAVYTALEMQEAVRKHFSALQTPSGIYRFRQRIGINTGHLFAGNAGAPNLRQEYTLMGDDINMAARLMSHAGWQEILISKKTQEHVTAFFELKDRGQLKVKGKEILIHAFEAVARREEIGRTRGLDFGESPLTGRDEAIETLKSTAQELLRRRGQITSIIGNSGLGKSRLTREMRSWLLDEAKSQDVDLLWLEGQSLSFSEQMSYWLAVQVFQGVLGLERDASPDDVLFALWERGEALLGKETAREAIPFLAHLIGLELEGEWAKWVDELDPSVRQKQTFWAAREFFTAAARKRAIVIALDDLHWADEASLALVEDLLSVTDHVPLMFWLIFRARRDKGCWRLRDKAASAFPHRYTEVRLAPLSEADSRELLGKLLPGAVFDPDTEQEILDKAAGNPFYLEEVVRSLIDSGAVVPDPNREGYWAVTGQIKHITVPGTLQAAIVARIDRLTEDARRALQMASVIGRRFQVGMLRNLSKAEAHLDAWLAQLERSGLIRPVDAGGGSGTDMAYAFPDALVQEVAYDSLLVQSRQQFHRQIGEALESTFEGKHEQACDMLAYHFHRSDDPTKAMQYLEMSGRVAQAKFANETAMQRYSDLLGRLGERDETWEKRFDILALRQKIYGLWGQQEERQADLDVMLTLAQTHNDAGRHSDALNILADFYFSTGRYAEAEKAARDTLAIKMTLEDPAGQAAALNTIGVLNYVRGDYDKARAPLEQAVALRRQAQDAEGEAWSMMYLGMIDFMTGNYDNAARHHEHALEMARHRKDWFQEGIHLTNAARVAHRMGKYEQALHQFLSLIHISEPTRPY